MACRMTAHRTGTPAGAAALAPPVPLRTVDDPTVTNGDVLGFSVALDGDRVLIGTSGDDTQGTDVGQAHLFGIAADAPLEAVADLARTDPGGDVLTPSRSAKNAQSWRLVAGKRCRASRPARDSLARGRAIMQAAVRSRPHPDPMPGKPEGACHAGGN